MGIGVTKMMGLGFNLRFVLVFSFSRFEFLDVTHNIQFRYSPFLLLVTSSKMMIMSWICKVKKTGHCKYMSQKTIVFWVMMRSYGVTIQMKPLQQYFHGTIYLVCNSNFWVCGWNPMVLPFKWNLFNSTFDSHGAFYLVCSSSNSLILTGKNIWWYRVNEACSVLLMVLLLKNSLVCSSFAVVEIPWQMKTT